MERGIWSDAAGGFIEAGLYSNEKADRACADLVAQGEDADDLSILAICPWHEEQIATSCEECEES